MIPEGRFEPDKALELIQDEQVTIWATVPTMVWRVCEHPDRHDYDTSSVIQVAFGGSPVGRRAPAQGPRDVPQREGPRRNAYGLTESSSVATVITGQDALDRPTSVGPPDAGRGAADRRRRRHRRSTGQTGEVCIKGPIIMPGYWGKPEATAETVVDGWLHTGDIGHLDEDGYLYITDRAKDMIIRGGENIYCVEIENRLVEHPAIADAAVIGVPHPELGEEVKAVVQVEPGESITEDEVRAWVAEAARQLQGPDLRRRPRRQAAPQRLRQAPEERAPRRGRGQLRGDDVAAVRPEGHTTTAAAIDTHDESAEGRGGIGRVDTRRGGGRDR